MRASNGGSEARLHSRLQVASDGRPRPAPDEIDDVVFSGGGSEFLSSHPPTGFGDLGAELGLALRHRHGPGRVIVIPSGEGYSVMWLEGGEKVVVPWQEAALFVPPDRWFHQHFNLGDQAARYLALHPPIQFAGYAEKVEDRARDQIEYPQEDPWVREKFERELAQRGLTSLMPGEADQDATHAGQK